MLLSLTYGSFCASGPRKAIRIRARLRFYRTPGRAVANEPAGPGRDIMARMAFDCRKCGACCCEFDVLLDPVDSDRFEAESALVQLTVLYQGRFHPAPRFMRRDERGRCVALSGEPGDCACGIYEQRPELCRAFEAGSDDCLAARAKHGIADST